jgi:hypothetical protein
VRDNTPAHIYAQPHVRRTVWTWRRGTRSAGMRT